MSEISSEGRSKKCIRCHENNVWRILLRNCNHIICIGCGLEHLRIQIKDEQKARIKCPENCCGFRIHENDIRALLNKENPDLDHFMIPSQRDWLLFHHDQDVLRYALGGDNFSKQCPLCLNFYAKLDGCNYVRCANLRCNQWFCFSCGDPVESWQHFAQNRCKVGWDDVIKLTYFFRFLLTAGSCTNIFIFPFISITILMFDLVTLVLELFGYGNWKQILQDSKAARMEIEIEQIQEENEDSEELNSVERKTKQATLESRKIRAMGAQAKGGPINVTKIVEKGFHNLEAFKKGNFKDIQILKIKDVKVSKPSVVLKHASKAKRIGKFI